MGTTTIIRIEHPSNGIGIFRNDDDLSVFQVGFKRLRARHNSKFDTPKEDIFTDGFQYFCERYYFCAFKSVEQVKKWITNCEMKRLIKLGYQVLMLEVSECHIGKFQVMYNKDYIVKSTNITDIFYKAEK